MKKVLIVDDEFLARLGLKTLIDWEEFGYKIVERLLMARKHWKY